MAHPFEQHPDARLHIPALPPPESWEPGRHFDKTRLLLGSRLATEQERVLSAISEYLADNPIAQIFGDPLKEPGPSAELLEYRQGLAGHDEDGYALTLGYNAERVARLGRFAAGEPCDLPERRPDMGPDCE